jgi:hypothetical protein
MRAATSSYISHRSLPEIPRIETRQSPARSENTCSISATMSTLSAASPVLCVSTVTDIYRQFSRSPPNACAAISSRIYFEIGLSHFLGTARSSSPSSNTAGRGLKVPTANRQTETSRLSPAPLRCRSTTEGTKQLRCRKTRKGRLRADHAIDVLVRNQTLL